MTWTPEDRAPRKHRGPKESLRKGLVIVYTGEGKGKSTAALGLVFRALGRKYRVAVVQFIKGKWKTGEEAMARELSGRIDWFTMGDGFTWITQNYDEDVASAKCAWAKCLELMRDEQYQVIVFDELNYVIAYNFLSVEEVLEGLKQKPVQTHVVITGRDAKPELIEIADLVTEMREIKHPYRSGIKAQPGIDF